MKNLLEICVFVCFISMTTAAIIQGPIHTARLTGNDIMLTCQVQLLDNDVFQWREYISDVTDGRTIYDSERDQVIDPTKYEHYRGGSLFELTLKRVTPEMAGYYGCVLVNENVKANASVVVTEKLQCSADPEDLTTGDKTFMYGEALYYGDINSKTFIIGAQWTNLPSFIINLPSSRATNRTSSFYDDKMTFHAVLKTNEEDHQVPYKGVFFLTPQPDREDLMYEDTCTLRLSIKHEPQIVGITVNDKQIADTTSSIPVRVEDTVVCNASSYPEPEFLWKNPDMSFNSPQFVVSDKMMGQFEMNCTVTNSVGSTSTMFRFDVDEAASSAILRYWSPFLLGVLMTFSRLL